MTNKKKSCSWTYRIFILLTLISTAGMAAIALEFVSKKMLPCFCLFILLWFIYDICSSFNLLFGSRVGSLAAAACHGLELPL